MYNWISTLLCLLAFPAVLSAQLSFDRSHHIQSERLLRMDSLIEAGDYERITSVLVARDGKVLFENYYGGHDESSQHNVRSGTKTMATLLTGIAMDKGFIGSERDPILRYLDHKLPVQHPDPRKDAITIEDLLTMSSILECNDGNQFSRGNEERMYLIEDWTKFYLDLPVRAFTFEPDPSEQPYGRSFSYCSAGAATMAEVIQSAVGSSLDEFAKKYLFEPLGITDYTLDHNPQGILNTAGGSNYRSRDFLKLIQMCLNGGTWEGQRIISQSWIEKATTPKAVAWEDAEYGYLFWIKKFGENQAHQSFYMSGNGGQKMLAIPGLNVCVVITTKNYGNRKGHAYTDQLVNDFILPALVDE